jgi:hypothetical protein
MNYPMSKLIWIPFMLGGCDFLFPPCTNYKKEVCACDDAGAMMCELAEATEEMAQEYKDNDDEDRYDSAQDACETLLDAWDEADGCAQYEDGGGDSDGGDSDGGDSDGGDSDGGDSDGGDSDGGDSDGGGSDGGGSSGGDATINCEGDCAFWFACYEEDEGACMTSCLTTWADEGYCDGSEASQYKDCAIAAASSCDEATWEACDGAYPNALTECN